MRISKGVDFQQKVSKPPRTRQDTLAKAAVERTYRDVMSGVWDDRSQFHAMLDFARPGDTSVVWRLDRLGRSLKHLIETVMGLQTCEINFRSLVVSSDDQLQGPLLRSSELTAIIYWMYRAERRSSYIMTEHIDTSTPC